MKKLIKNIVFILPFVALIVLLLIKNNLFFKPELKYLKNDLNKQNIQKSQSSNNQTQISKKDSIYPNNKSWYFLDPTEFDKKIQENNFEEFKNINEFNEANNLYKIHCQFCHDSLGSGNGEITKVELDSLEEGFPKPQDLTRTITKNFSKDRLFHILTSGQNLMFSVSHKLDERQRKLILNYIHYLQNNSATK